MPTKKQLAKLEKHGITIHEEDPDHYYVQPPGYYQQEIFEATECVGDRALEVEQEMRRRRPDLDNLRRYEFDVFAQQVASSMGLLRIRAGATPSPDLDAHMEQTKAELEALAAEEGG